MSFGVTAQGFVKKTAADIDAELDSDLKTSILGASAGTEPDGSIPKKSIAGQIKVWLVDGFAAMWDLALAVYSALDPAKATGAAQDAVCSITGTIREQKKFSTVTATATGDPGTVLILGRVATVTITGSRFDSTAPETIAALAAWAGTHGYFVNDRVTNAARAYICITAGTSAGSGGPTTTAADITDGTVHWKYLGEGTGAVDVPMEAEEAGPIGALSGQLSNIGTPVNGWKSVTNLLDAEVGSNEETDAELRLRRDQDLAAQGNTTPEAIEANVLNVNQTSQDPAHQPPKAVRVFANDTDATDANGVPPHSVEVLVQGGTDQDIANEIWRSVGGGTATFGNQAPFTVIDSQGNPQTIYFSRPVAVPIYLVTTAFYDPQQWPATGAPALVQQAVLSALLTYGDAFPIGVDVRATPLAAAVLRSPSQLDDTGLAVVPAADDAPPAPGIVDVDPMHIGTAPAPGSSTAIVIGVRQIATFDSSRITITATPEAP